MNKVQRLRLREAQSYLDKAANIVSFVKDEEQDKLDNAPENLESAEIYVAIDKAIDELDEALSNIESAKESIDNAC